VSKVRLKKDPALEVILEQLNKFGAGQEKLAACQGELKKEVLVGQDHLAASYGLLRDINAGQCDLRCELESNVSDARASQS
jgi:hypothetical protein